MEPQEAKLQTKKKVNETLEHLKGSELQKVKCGALAIEKRNNALDYVFFMVGFRLS